MKTITVNVSEPVYKDFQRFAKERDRSTSELIREAMEAYRDLRIRSQPTFSEWRPTSLGALKSETFAADGDLLDEMIHG